MGAEFDETGALARQECYLTISSRQRERFLRHLGKPTAETDSCWLCARKVKTTGVGFCGDSWCARLPDNRGNCRPATAPTRKRSMQRSKNAVAKQPHVRSLPIEIVLSIKVGEMPPRSKPLAEARPHSSNLPLASDMKTLIRA